jgi:hypothetical protein
MANAFKVGDVVALKSGGVPMTVADLPWLSHADIYIVPVAWDVAGTIMRDGLPEDALELAKRVVATYALSPEQIFDVVEGKFVPVNADNLRHNRN